MNLSTWAKSSVEPQEGESTVKKVKIREGSIADHCIKIWKPVAVLASTGLIICGMAAAQLAFAAEEPAEAQNHVTVNAAAESPSEMIPEPAAAIWSVPLEEELQLFIAGLCEEYHIQPELVLAVIEQESQYNPEAIGDSGRSYGLMQVQPRWHSERMQQLGCTDLLDPYQNVTVGIDILAEKLEGGLEWGLMAYNGGNQYADSMKSRGEVSEYAEAVIMLAEELEGGACDVSY